MNELVPWLALAIAALTAIAGLWDRLVNTGKDKQRLASAESAASAALAKADLVMAHLVEFKVEAAREYITNRELNDAVTRIETRLTDLMAQNTDQHNALTRRLDALFSKQ